MGTVPAKRGPLAPMVEQCWEVERSVIRPELHACMVRLDEDKFCLPIYYRLTNSPGFTRILLGFSNLSWCPADALLSPGETKFNMTFGLSIIR